MHFSLQFFSQYVSILDFFREKKKTRSLTLVFFSLQRSEIENFQNYNFLNQL
ncbi:hypothetical protein CVCAS_1424 [Lactococcus lactis subsp. lactis CV56]|nr:hypothetical protein CVCAS_1424 [Lactococcus lactis subsp. lactis CV56]